LLALLIAFVLPQLLSWVDVKWKCLFWVCGRCPKNPTKFGNSAGFGRKLQSPSFNSRDFRSRRTWCLPNVVVDQRGDPDVVVDQCKDPKTAEGELCGEPQAANSNIGPAWVPEAASRPALQQAHTEQQQFQAVPETAHTVSANTQRIFHIPGHVHAEMLRLRLDLSGLRGAYDWFWMPVHPTTGLSKGEAFINLVHPFFVSMLQSALAELPYWGKVETAAAVAAPPAAAVAAPPVRPVTRHIIKQRALEAPQVAQADDKFSMTKEIHGHLLKTKLCVFHAKGRCRRGTACGFAHSHAELKAPPDFCKTKPCYDFHRGQCGLANCKFAHGIEELRIRKVTEIPEQLPSCSSSTVTDCAVF